MRNLRIIILSIFIGGLLLSASFSYASAYNPQTTHFPLAQNSTYLYNQFYPQEQLSEQEKQWIAQGAAEEDSPSLRAFYHFYDPINNKGVQGYASSKVWAHSAALQSSFGIYTWERAIEAYNQGDNEYAYKSVGHILHLIQDATVPAHTRQDPHPPQYIPFAESIFGSADPYEHATEDLYFSDISGLSPVIYSDVNTYFDNVAFYTNTHFLSQDSIGVYDEPRPLRVDGKFVYTKDGKGEYRLASVLDTSYISDKNYSLRDPLVIQDYWQRLAPVAIENGAGIIKLFHESVAQQQNIQISQQATGWLGRAAKNLTNGTTNFFNNIYSATRFASQFTSLLAANLQADVDIEVSAFSIPNINISRQISEQQKEGRDTFNSQLASLVEESQYQEAKGGSTVALSAEQNAVPSPQDIQEDVQFEGLGGEPLIIEEEESQTLHLVTRVIDGDTIELANGEHVRYIGIDAPESGECFGEEATRANSELALNKYVFLEEGPDDRDAYERLLRYIWIGPTLVNQELIEGGYAYAYDFGFTHKYSQIFEKLEQNARENQLGLWGPDCQEEQQQEEEPQAEDETLQPPPPPPVVHYSSPQPTTYLPILISEIQIAGSTVRDEFVELYNPNDVSVDMSGWKLTRKKSTGTEENLVSHTAFSETIPALSYFLIVPQPNEDGTPNYTGEVAADREFSGVSYTITPNNTVILYNPNGDVVDLVGMGTAVDFEIYAAEEPETGFSLGRKFIGSEYQDTNNNLQNFEIQSPTPKSVNVSSEDEGAEDEDDEEEEGEDEDEEEVEDDEEGDALDHIIINEIQVADSEFVELFNPTDTTLNLDSYYFSYYSSTKTEWNDTRRNWAFPANAAISSNNYYLLGIKDYPVSNGNPDADWQVLKQDGNPYTSGQLANSKGTVAIFAEDPTCSGLEQCNVLPIDAVAWGDDAKITLKEASTVIAPSVGQSISRDSRNIDTNDNSVDFMVGALTPTNSAGETYDENFSAAPMWASYQNNAQNTGLVASAGPAWVDSTEVNVAWEVSLGGISADISQPVIDSDGNIYVASQNFIYSYAPDGDLRWDYEAKGSSGLALSADSSYLYVVGCIHDVGCDFTVLRTDIGSRGVQFTIADEPQNGGPTKPVVDAISGNVYVATVENIFAYEKNGSQLLSLEWDCDIVDWVEILARDDACTYVPRDYVALVRDPVIYDDKLYIVAEPLWGDAYLFKFDAVTVTFGWQQDMEQDLITHITGSPSINTDGTLFVGYKKFNNKFGIAAFDTEDEGELKWKVQTGTRHSLSLALDTEDTIYAQLISLTENSEGDGASVGHVFISSDYPSLSAQVVIDSQDRIYASTDAGILYVVSKNSTASAPEIFWQYDFGSAVKQIVLADGVVYIITSEVKIYALK